MVLSPLSIIKATGVAGLVFATLTSALLVRDEDESRRVAAASDASKPTPFPFIAAEAPDYNNRVIGTMLRQSNTLRLPRDGYAVFGWDNIAMFGDLAEATLAYQVETLNFRLRPSDILPLLTMGYYSGTSDECMPDNYNQTLGSNGAGNTFVRLSTVALSLQADYQWLWENYIGATYRIEDNKVTPRKAKALGEVRADPHYNNFRAKLAYLANTFTRIAAEHPNSDCGVAMANTFTAKLLTGMTEREIRDLARKSVRWNLSTGVERRFYLDSDTQIGGSLQTGLRIANGQESMMRALRLHHVHVYVVSEAPEILVQEVSTMKDFGFRMDKTQVFGTRYQFDTNGKFVATPAVNYPIPVGLGKVEIITRFISPKHHYEAPLLASGVSEDDCDMLGTVNKGGVVHIVNGMLGEGTCMHSLYRKACALYDKTEPITGVSYLLQGVNVPLGTWVQSGYSSPDGVNYASGIDINNGCSVYDFKDNKTARKPMPKQGATAWTPTQPPTWAPTQPPTWTPTQWPTWTPTQFPTWTPTQPPNWTPTQWPTWTPTQPPNWTPGSQWEGQSIRCIGFSDVWRVVNGVLRVYATPDVAAAWDPNWMMAMDVDCSGIPRGEDITTPP